ncbi:MADS-box transcription factor 22-like [Hevea brasiliensis]|uniref:MADS-box transcription factor 22-like n=1 Tax=Hevea brasiliensis TaxID=3981 RepID=UPI0025D79C10|nr:MADS-box transcription factor 22-like [Hevea brasiliensis]
MEEEGPAAEGVSCADAAGTSCAKCAGSIESCGTGGADCSPGCAVGPVSVTGCAVSNGGKLKLVLNKLEFTMGRKKLSMKKIDDTSRLRITYLKRKDGLMKKANELAVLCDTDVGLLMFSPTAKLNIFSNKRIEDIFLRYINHPKDLQVGLTRNKEQAKLFASQIQPRNLENLEQAKLPDSQIQPWNLENLEEAKLLYSQIQPCNLENLEVPIVMNNDNLRNEAVIGYDSEWNPSRDGNQCKENFVPVGPHLSLDYLKAHLEPWKLSKQ